MPQTSINRVTLVGNLTADPELRPLPSGYNVCKMRVACNGRRRNIDGGYDSRPHYFSVSVFGPRSEQVHRYLRKGRAVAIYGRLEWHQWETPDQQRRESVTIVASDIQFLRGPAHSEEAVGVEEHDTEDRELEDIELLTATEGIEGELNKVEVELEPSEEDGELVASAVGEDGELLF
jgi:single-strand DNA-binding protein